MPTLAPATGAYWRYNAVHRTDWLGVDCHVTHFPATTDGPEFWELETFVLGTRLSRKDEVFDESRLGARIRELCVETLAEGLSEQVLTWAVRK